MEFNVPWVSITITVVEIATRYRPARRCHREIGILGATVTPVVGLTFHKQRIYGFEPPHSVDEGECRNHHVCLL
jgi:hypothetical protein